MREISLKTKTNKKTQKQIKTSLICYDSVAGVKDNVYLFGPNILSIQ